MKSRAIIRSKLNLQVKKDDQWSKAKKLSVSVMNKSTKTCVGCVTKRSVYANHRLAKKMWKGIEVFCQIRLI